MRTSQHFQFELTETRKKVLLQWSQNYEHVIWLDSNAHDDVYGSFDALLAIGAKKTLSDFKSLQEYIDKGHDWLFGYFSYDMKNGFEDLTSNNFDGLGFPELYFFVPEKVLLFKENKVCFMYLEALADQIHDDYRTIQNFMVKVTNDRANEPIKIRMRIHKDAYFSKVEQLKYHIHRGDIYEVNFCQEFYSETSGIDPVHTYVKLNEISNPPFAVYLRLGEKYLLSASPERYLKKVGQKIISQPMKGTARRSKNGAEDKRLKNALASDLKERAENIMITDLVRNDLSRLAKKGTVKVEELCKVHSYRQVHQMISTVSCEIASSVSPLETIKMSFPMGSMTGAPKISAMQLIEKLEETKRGLYSGAVGYFSPSGDFDFNVVIRSILYDATNCYTSYSVGSAITAKSDIEKEYQECLLKAKAMRTVLEG